MNNYCFTEMKRDLKEVRADVKEVRADVKEVGADVKEMGADVKAVRSTGEETNKIVKEVIDNLKQKQESQPGKCSTFFVFMID